MVQIIRWVISVLVVGLVSEVQSFVQLSTDHRKQSLGLTVCRFGTCRLRGDWRTRRINGVANANNDAYRNGEAASFEVLSPFESWCVSHLEKMYTQALSIRCPFWKRRASDILDALDEIMRFLVIRHKSLDLVGPPAGWKLDGIQKSKYLDSDELLLLIRADWQVKTNKGYYITGRLNTTIYRDGCVFDGPDPDMPVRGLRKYLNAASQLFDPVHSRAELLSLEVVEDQLEGIYQRGKGHQSLYKYAPIVATWRMWGVLRLPWKPILPEWTGTTTYFRDEEGLIYKHVETWDMSTLQAFVKTFWPDLAEGIWD